MHTFRWTPVLALHLLACQADPDPRVTGPATCGALVVVDPVTTSPVAGRPRNVHVAPWSGDSADYFVSWVAGAEFTSLPLHAARMVDPFATWPPAITNEAELSPSVVFHELADSDRGRSVLVDGHSLLRPGEPPLELFEVGGASTQFAEFASTIGTRTLVGSALFAPQGQAFALLHGVTSIDGNARIVEVVPEACALESSSAAVAQLPAWAPKPGFLVALTSSATAIDACTDGGSPTIVEVERYLVPADRAFGAEHASGARVDAGGTVSTVQLVRSAFGAWLVFGALDEASSQSIRAVPLGVDGNALAGATEVFSPARGAAPSGPFEASSVGEDLVVAWTDFGPAPKQVHVQLVHADGALGASATVTPPGDATRFADVEVVGSPDRRGLLLGWEKEGEMGNSVGMARLDCLEGASSD